MSKQFDELSKVLARDISRREALRRLAAGLTAMALSGLGVRRVEAAPNPCAVFCSQFFPPGPARAACKQACQRCGGDVSRVCFGATNAVCCAPDAVCCISPSGAATCCAPEENCMNGECTLVTCTEGGICPGTFFPCGGSAGISCTCLSSVEGDVQCVDVGLDFCAQPACETSEDCGPDGVCVTAETLAECCGTTTPICLPACGTLTAAPETAASASPGGWSH